MAKEKNKNTIKKVGIIGAICAAFVIGIMFWISSMKVTITYDLGIAEVVINNKDFKKTEVWKGTVINPASPYMELAKFDGWLIKHEGTYVPYDLSQPITEDITLYANWKLDENDLDGDDLNDSFERYLKTSINNPDTDGDGVSDYIEYMAGTDPTKADTDGDGRSDAYDEIVLLFQKDDSEIDTDGDGASDKWEKDNGYDYNKPDKSFKVTTETETYGEDISASVTVMLEGNQINTLNVTTVGYMDSVYVTPAIAGYLGSAFEFNVDGSFQEATITIEYDKYRYGRVSKDFQPRIYYVNETKGTLDELPNQTVSDGKVSVNVTHFSKYILLNKVEFDKVWETEIMSPEDKGLGMNVVFAVDNSASMAQGDANNLRYSVVTAFIEKFGAFDKAGIIYFERSAHVLKSITSDFTQFESLLNGIKIDDGSDMHNSGTSTIVALRKAAEQFSSSVKAKVIVLLSDGRDSGGYDEEGTMAVIEELKAAGIIVYAIGVGDVDSVVMKRYAEETGGKYFYACTQEDLEAAKNSLESYSKMSEEDLTLDSNNDGISDYFANLIYRGELVFGNGSKELMGLDLSQNADFDGDGLVNGDEIKVVIEPLTRWQTLMNANPRIYLEKKTDVRYADTDGDTFLDEEEYKMGMDPLTPGIPDEKLNYLMDVNNYFYESAYKGFFQNYLDKVLFEIGVAAFGEDAFTLYQELIVAYISDWGENSNITNGNEEVIEIIGYLRYYIDVLVSGAERENLDAGESFYSEIMLLALSDINKVQGDYYNKEKIISETWVLTLVNKDTPQEYLEYKLKTDTVTVKKRTWSKNISDAMDLIGVASTSLSILDQIFLLEEVDLYWKEFYYNLEFLQKIEALASDERVAAAAKSIMDALENEGENEIKVIVEKVIEYAIEEGVALLLEKNPYGVYVTVAQIVIDITIDIIKDMESVDENIKQMQEIILYRDMSRAALVMANIVYDKYDCYYEINIDHTEAEGIAAINHLCRLRILAEDKTYDLAIDEKDKNSSEAKLTELKKNIGNSIYQTAFMLKEWNIAIPKTEMYVDIFKRYGKESIYTD